MERIAALQNGIADGDARRHQQRHHADVIDEAGGALQLPGPAPQQHIGADQAAMDQVADDV